MEEVRLLVKFGKVQHLEQLQKEGLFYCNPIKYFLSIEDGKLRGDEMESVYKLQYMVKPDFEVKDANKPDAPWLKLNVTNAQYKESYSNPLGNIFSMSAFKIIANTNPSIFTIDNRYKEFGGHFLLVHNQAEFLERIKTALQVHSVSYKQGLVEYLELKKYTGSKTLFQKDLEYSYQEEFRIFLQTDSNSPFTFSIGSIEHISELYDVEKVSLLHYKLPTNE
jgi:hypothetical protein